MSNEKPYAVQIRFESKRGDNPINNKKGIVYSAGRALATRMIVDKALYESRKVHEEYRIDAAMSMGNFENYAYEIPTEVEINGKTQRKGDVDFNKAQELLIVDEMMEADKRLGAKRFREDSDYFKDASWFVDKFNKGLTGIIQENESIESN